MSTTSNTYDSPNTTTNKQETGYVEQAGNALSSAAATISSYLPTSVTDAVTGLSPTADTTTAYRNQQPHHGGVGDLGTTSTADVTRLPEERQNPDPLSNKSTTTDISAANPAFTHPVGVQNQYNNRQEGETFPAGTSGVGAPGAAQVPLASMSGTTGAAAYGVGGHSGAPGGVGDLGTTSMEGVAVLPEERANAAYSTSVTSGTGAGSMNHGVGGHPGVSGGVGDLGTQSTADVALLPEERAHPNPYSESTTTGMSTTDKVKSVLPGSTSGTGQKHDTTTSSTSGNMSAKDKVKSAVTGSSPTHQDTVLDENDTANAAGLGGHDGRHHDITKEGSTGGHTGASYDVDHGLGMPHTRSMAPTGGVTEQLSSHTPSSTTHHATENAPHTSTDHNEQVLSPKEAGYPTGKPSLMDKVKGTAIIAAAKMGGGKDEDKIQQGQMLKETGKKINPEEEARRTGSMETGQY